MPDSVQAASFSQADVDIVVHRELTLAAQTFSPQEKPQAILLAGQPGAGKTELSTMLVASLYDDAVFINADEFRRYCPGYRELYRKYGSDVVSFTAPFSAAVTEQLIAQVSDQHRNLVIEGTGRTVDVPRSTAELLSARGYEVQMAVIAARPEVSLASTLLRFCRMNEGGTIPRATALEAHDAVVKALPGNLDILNACENITRIRIWNRELTLLYDSVSGEGAPSQALLGAWNCPWTAQELDDIKGQLRILRADPVLQAIGQQAVLDELVRRVEEVG